MYKLFRTKQFLKDYNAVSKMMRKRIELRF